MKIEKRVKFEMIISKIFDFPIIEFDPEAVFGSGWKFAPEINGPAENDGVTGFQEAVLKASILPKDQGYRLLFATGLTAGNKVITGENRIKVIPNVNFADPDLPWSLYKEGDQRTLRYFHDTYGVNWMESLRRILLSPRGGQCALCIRRDIDGSWDHDYYWLSDDRDTDNPVLSFAS